MELSVNSGTAPPEAASGSSSPQLKIADLLILLHGIHAPRRPCMGSGEDGKLGMGYWEEGWDDRIQFLEPKNVVTGSRNSRAICGNGQLYTWGWNQRGTLYHPPETKTENILSLVDSLSGVKIVQVDTASGGWHSHALTDDGEQVVCTGIRGEHGRLSFGDDKSSKMVPQKVQLLMGANIVQLNWLAINENKNIIEYLVEAFIQWH